MNKKDGTPRKPMRTYPKPVPEGYRMSQTQKVLRRYRVMRGYSRQRLENKSGIFSRTIEKWEVSNEVNPGIYHFARALDVLDCEIWVVDRRKNKLVDRIY